MSCKYCFQNDHTIEQCKTILCRVCKDIGHPHWLCTKDKKSVKKTPSKPMASPKKEVKPTYSSILEPKEQEKVIKNEPPKITVATETKRDLSFYLKQSTRKWSDIL